jgi:energy-coupling factor transport system permease protein
MAFMNPVFLMISFVFSLGYAVSLDGKNALGFFIKVLPLSFISILVNVLFNHRGSTIICYFLNGNPFTLESLVFGISASFMILSTIFWFYSFHRIVTSDKLLYIFGKILPSFSLLLSMALRFVPKLTREIKEMVMAQKCLGKDTQKSGFYKRFSEAKLILSAEISIAFENAMDTATSMRMRGFHEKDIKIYALYQMSHRDKAVAIVMICSFMVILYGIYQKYFNYRYFPSFQLEQWNERSICFVGMFLVLVSIPLFLEIGEMIKWRKSK